MSIKTNLIVDQGSNFVYKIYLVDTDGLPFPITGFYGNAQIRKSYSSSSFTTMDITIDDVGGIITLSMNAAVTSTLNQNRYVYDLQLTGNTGIVSRIAEGFVTINPEVTR